MYILWQLQDDWHLLGIKYSEHTAPEQGKSEKEGPQEELYNNTHTFVLIIVNSTYYEHSRLTFTPCIPGATKIQTPKKGQEKEVFFKYFQNVPFLYIVVYTQLGVVHNSASLRLLVLLACIVNVVHTMNTLG